MAGIILVVIALGLRQLLVVAAAALHNASLLRVTPEGKKIYTRLWVLSVRRTRATGCLVFVVVVLAALLCAYAWLTAAAVLDRIAPAHVCVCGYAGGRRLRNGSRHRYSSLADRCAMA